MQRGIEMPSRRAQPDAIAIGCVLLIALGWFLMNTLVFSLGSVVQPTRFYQLLAVLSHPAMLLVGVGNAAAPEVWLFTLLCLLVLSAAAAPYLSQRFAAQRAAALTGWLPLIVMLGGLLALYGGGTPERAADSAAGNSLGGQLLHLAHQAMRQAMQSAQTHVASHISPGVGGVLSFAASVVLAVRTTVRRRQSAAQR